MNKLLIVGKQNALIEAIAHRFSKEGFKIVIISNTFKNSKFRIFKENLDDNKYKHIFKRNSFKCVIYLDYFEDINKLNKLLKFSSSYKVRNFIRITDFIKDSESNNIYASLSHSICSIFRDYFTNSMNITNLRLPIIYGEGLAEDFVDKNIFIIMDNLIKGKDILYDDTLERRYIHVNDASETAYLSFKYSLNDKYTISSNYSLSLNDLSNILKGNTYYLNINQYLNNSYQSNFSDNTKFKEKYSILKELPIIYERYKNNVNASKKIKSNKYKKLKIFLKHSKPYVENIVLFIIVYLISKMISPVNSVFYFLDIKLIYIIVIGILYGSKQSLIATFLSCALLIVQSLDRGISIVSILVLNESLIQLLTYVLIGVYVGYVSDFKNVQIKTLKNENKKQEDEYDFLEDLYNKTYNEKKELEEKVISSKDSFGKIYSVVKKLDSLQPQYILKSSIDILEEFLDSNRIAIYTLKNNFLRLNVKSNNEDFKPTNNIDFDKLNIVKDHIQEGELFINKGLDISIPMMVAPIKKGNKVIATIMIEELEFSKMNLYYENLFKVISNLIESSIIKAYDYEELTSKERYIYNTIFLNENSFKKLLKIKQIAKFEKKLDYTLLKIDNTFDLKLLSQIIKSSIRETDFAGIIDDSIYVLLLNTKKEESYIPINRLESKGVSAKVMEEVINND
ncbi:NAD(P)-dependent oxidoreductase [Clostridium sp.]|uniref:NAD(P)-dependent oxidoreductase n=1 Tax=Clostridium sp. TaxID=1506 RepID=UPI002635A696